MSELPFKIGFPYVVFSCQLITKNRKHFKQSTGAPSKSWVGGPQRSHAFSAPKRLVCWTNVATKKSAGFLWWFFSYKPYLKVWWLKTYKRLLCPNSTSWMRAMQQTNPLSVDFFMILCFFLHRWMCNSICRIAQLIFLGDDFLVLTMFWICECALICTWIWLRLVYYFDVCLKSFSFSFVHCTSTTQTLD